MCPWAGLLASRSMIARSTTGHPAPAAVLWDMDGTLVDTEPHWIAAEQELVTAHGGRWSHADGLTLVGNPLPVSARALQDAGVRLGVEEVIAYLIAAVAAHVRRAVPWQPGAWELLAGLRAAHVPCALVTMSYRELADGFVEQLPAGTFDAVVTGDQVRRGKPDPEPYLLAARRLGVDPASCVAIEDSPAGVGSALAAGARTLAVEVNVPISARPGLSRTHSLAAVDQTILARIAAGEVLDLMAEPPSS